MHACFLVLGLISIPRQFRTNPRDGAAQSRQVFTFNEDYLDHPSQTCLFPT